MLQSEREGERDKEAERQRDRGKEGTQRERGESFATCRVRDHWEVTLCKRQLWAKSSRVHSRVGAPKHFSSYPRSTCANKCVLQPAVSRDGVVKCNVISITHHDAPVDFVPISFLISLDWDNINGTKKAKDFQAGTDLHYNQQLEEWMRSYGILLVRTNLNSFSLLQ